MFVRLAVWGCMALYINNYINNLPGEAVSFPPFSVGELPSDPDSTVTVVVGDPVP